MWLSTGAFLRPLRGLQCGLNELPKAPCYFAGEVSPKHLKFTMSVAYYMPKQVAQTILEDSAKSTLHSPDIFLQPYVKHSLFPNPFGDQAVASLTESPVGEQGSDLYMSADMQAKACTLGFKPPAAGAGWAAVTKWQASL